jgi:hypothetical protein
MSVPENQNNKETTMDTTTHRLTRSDDMPAAFTWRDRSCWEVWVDRGRGEFLAGHVIQSSGGSWVWTRRRTVSQQFATRAAAIAALVERIA